jgi:hypothetical protein
MPSENHGTAMFQKNTAKHPLNNVGHKPKGHNTGCGKGGKEIDDDHLHPN